MDDQSLRCHFTICYTYPPIAHFQDHRRFPSGLQFKDEPTTSLDVYVEASLLQKVWNRPMAKPSPDMIVEAANSKIKLHKIRPNQICSKNNVDNYGIALHVRNT